jgi:hypothetical protein
MPIPKSVTEAQAARWHGDLVAIDPSLNSPGIAIFRHGVLHAAGRVRPDPAYAELKEDGDRWMRVADDLASWWFNRREGGKHYVRTVVYEKPQIYSESRGKSKGDPNKLIGLAAIGQSLAAILYAFNQRDDVRPPELLTPEPARWTGQLPKDTKAGRYWKSPRGIRIKQFLEPGEWLVVPDQHDAGDAIGLGGWGLGRYVHHRVFSGAVRS